MTFDGSDLGPIADLATALGLLAADGSFEDDWLANPGDHLKTILADDTQRGALLDFLDAVLGGSTRTTDTSGLLWLPLIEHSAPDLALFAVFDVQPTYVGVGVGVTITSTGTPAATARAHVPLFRAARTGQSVDSPLLIGQPGAPVHVSAEITVDASSPHPGEAHLGGVGVELTVPTAGEAQPQIGLTLRALQLPGAEAPEDYSLSLADSNQLEHSVLQLVFGLVKAEADALGVGPLAALSDLLGLGGGAIPAFPLAGIASSGSVALVEWFVSVVGDAGALDAWLAALAGLLGGGASVAEGAVDVRVGGADLQFRLAATTGTGGHPIVTARLSASVQVSADIALRAQADVVTLDLAAGTATALPGLEISAVASHASGGSGLLTGDPSCGAVRIGLALDAQRRPVFVLAADNVGIGPHHYDTLDLTSPGALADAAGALVGEVLQHLLGQLGSTVALALQTLLGIAAPAGHPEVGVAPVAQLVADPLGAVREYWRALLADHADAVPAALQPLRDLLTDASHSGADVTGAGTSDDPWRLPLAGVVEVQVFLDGPLVHLTVAARYVVTTLGQGCTRLETSLRLALASIDLAAGHVSFCSLVEASLAARARGADPAALLRIGDADVRADQIGVWARWSPGSGLGFGVLAPNLAVDTGTGAVPLVLPTLGVDGNVTLDAAGWDAVEQLLALLASAAPAPWLNSLVAALGWAYGTAPRSDRLRLADLIAAPADTLRSWFTGLALQGREEFAHALEALARAIGGSAAAWGIVEGTGRPDDPYRIPLGPAGPATPALAMWLLPDGPSRSATAAARPIRDWRPGHPGLANAALIAAIQDEATIGADVADLVSGRPDAIGGLEALIARWAGTDGRIVPPAATPAGVTVHTAADTTAGMLDATLDLAGTLGRPPASAIVHVGVAAPDADVGDVRPDIPAGRRVDLRAAGRDPDSFPSPAAADGEWLVVLGRRGDCVLPAGDPDGVAGQAARLRRLLDVFAAGSVSVVAAAEAGHAVLRALATQEADGHDVTACDVVTVGVSWGPVAFTIVDDQPAADTLRLLDALLPAADPDDPDDPDLALGRALIDGLIVLARSDDPGRELRPPSGGVDPAPAGVDVHAVFGVIGGGAIQRALTAVVAAGLSARARARADAVAAEATGVRIGLLVPVPAAGATVTAGGHALLEIAGLDLGGDGVSVTTDHLVHARLELRRAGGWLVGGPDPGRSPGPRPGHEIRWLEAEVAVPLAAGRLTGASRLVLHEARVFGLERERWVVTADAAVAAAAGLVGTAADAVTDALPEVRVLICDAVAELRAAAAQSPEIAAVQQLLTAVGVVAADGGAVPDAVDHLLHDPAAHVAAALSSAAGELSSALNALLGSAISLDLTARAATISLSGSPGSLGLVPWQINATVSTAGPPALTAALGAPGASAAGGALLRVAMGPQLDVALEWRRAGSASADTVALWPAPDVPALTRALALLVPAEISRIGLGYLRELDADARPVIDAALDAVGLLGPPDASGARGVRLPAGLLADPAGWFAHPDALGGSSGLAAAKAVALMDALRPMLGVPGGPGTWQLTDGVRVQATTQDGYLQLAVAVDTSGFTPIDTGGRLILAVTGGLTLPPGGAPAPSIDAAIGTGGAAPGTRALHVRLDSAGLTVFLRPASGADVGLYPAGPGLGALAAQAAAQALPLVLDAIAGLTGNPGVQGSAASAVAAAGDLLGVRTGGHFDGDALSAWAADPVASLQSALLNPPAAALTALAGALDSLLGGEGSASVSGGGIAVTVHHLSIGWTPSPLAVTVGADTDLPGLSRAAASLTLDAAGVRDLDVSLGPAAIDAGGALLRPYARVRAGSAPDGGRAVEVGLHGPGSTAVAARWHLGGAGLALLVTDGVSEQTDPAQVVTALADVVIDLVAGFVLNTDAVRQALSKSVGASTVREVLTGPVLQAGGGDPALVADLFDPAQALERVLRLAGNLAAAHPTVTIAGHLQLGLTEDAGRAGITLGVDGRATLGGDDIVVWLEADTRWIQMPEGSTVAPGLSVFLLDTSGASPALAAGLEVGGLGIRVGKDGGPLLDAGLTLGSIAVHTYGHIGGAESGLGIQVQLSDLAVGVGGAGNGADGVAEGIVKDSGSGGDALKPAFSPALAVQRHGNDPVLVSLTAGDGSGPWWLSIQKGFGPVYIEQVGFGVTVEQSQLQRISLLLDGRVSLFGLAAAVDDLQLTYAVAGGSFADPRQWSVDLAGFALSADMAGVTLDGGLRKLTQGESVQYVGMLIGRFAAYGLAVFGGYGAGIATDGTSYASFFAFGAVNGPIGGPPAFFLTGIGGGLGINRDLIVPGDMSAFGDYVLIKALDPAARPSSDPMAELAAVSADFPMKHGQIWFAAGIAFTSFALVDGVAVVSVSIGDGLEIDLLGLARMALPRPQIALVSVELGLIARFSTKEGVLWIQAQLTDNSWVLNSSVRLTGGFAFVTWYSGQYAGQFVLTIGGYHPDFHRDGYPIMPRLGLTWRLGDALCIKGESYFALTSEALMAGGRLEASATLGPAWAHIVFGADGIVYFDPFRFEVDVYAHISAGVTIDVWIGEISISISIGAQLHLEGPNFHGAATFSVGPVGVTVPFGDTTQNTKVPLTWEEFLGKYLETAAPGQARAISAITGAGTRAPGADGSAQAPTADGSAGRPYVVYPEFQLLVKTTVPAATLIAGGITANHAGAIIGVAPMNIADAATTLTLRLLDSGNTDRLGALATQASAGGAFPIGVWGAPQPDDDRKVPSGDVIQAIDGATFTATAAVTGTLPTPVSYSQVETGARKPLPFVTEAGQRPGFLTDSQALTTLASSVPADDQLATARRWLAAGGASQVALAAFTRDRAAPPLLGSLGEGFVAHTAPKADKRAVTAPAPEPPDRSVRPPTAVGLLTGDLAAPPVAAGRTTVSQAPGAPRVSPPDLVSTMARTDLGVPARLRRQPAVGQDGEQTVLAGAAVPLTRSARGAVAAVSGRIGAGDAKARLAGLTAALHATPPAGERPAGAAAAPAADPLRPGDLAVLLLPNAAFDADLAAPRPVLAAGPGLARVLQLSHGGAVLADESTAQAGANIEIVRGAERIAVLAGDTSPAASGGAAGWHAGQQLAYVGWSTALAPGATVHAEGGSIRRTRDRYRTGWVPGAELVDAATVVRTRFIEPVTAVALLLDDQLGTQDPRELVLSLDGAALAADSAGVALPPTVVALAHRSALVYAVIPGQNAAVEVGVARQPGWRLAGVLASTVSVADVAGRLTRFGVDAIVRPLVGPSPPGRGSDLVNLGWQPGQRAPTPAPAPAPGPGPAMRGDPT